MIAYSAFGCIFKGSRRAVFIAVSILKRIPIQTIAFGRSNTIIFINYSSNTFKIAYKFIYSLLNNLLHMISSSYLNYRQRNELHIHCQFLRFHRSNFPNSRNSFNKNHRIIHPNIGCIATLSLQCNANILQHIPFVNNLKNNNYSNSRSTDIIEFVKIGRTIRIIIGQ